MKFSSFLFCFEILGFLRFFLEYEYKLKNKYLMTFPTKFLYQSMCHITFLIMLTSGDMRTLKHQNRAIMSKNDVIHHWIPLSTYLGSKDINNFRNVHYIKYRH